MIHSISTHPLPTTPTQTLKYRPESPSSFSIDGHEAKVQAIRSKIVKHLEARMGKNEQAAAAAKCLEQLLFQSSSSLDMYQDMSTLESRIQLVLAVKLQRRMQKSSKKNRSQVLRKTLGKEQYLKTLQLVQEIKLCKNRKVATMKCTGGSCSRPFRNSFPAPIKNLFFDTPLINAFERSPVDRIPSLNWAGLSSNAEENLRAYNEYID